MGLNRSEPASSRRNRATTVSAPGQISHSGRGPRRNLDGASPRRDATRGGGDRQGPAPPPSRKGFPTARAPHGLDRIPFPHHLVRCGAGDRGKEACSASAKDIIRTGRLAVRRCGTRQSSAAATLSSWSRRRCSCTGRARCRVCARHRARSRGRTRDRDVRD